MHARRLLTVAAATAITVGVAGPAVAEAATPSAAPPVQVVVREDPGAGAVAQQAVARLGGSVGRELKLINGFTASVPADRLAVLRAVPGVAEVTEDAGLTLSDADVTGQVSQAGSLYTLANQVTGASALWNQGATGQGVDVALVDSGVVPVNGLSGGKVVYGPDLTEESGTGTQNLDTYGHGTAMAGIIAGKDDGASSYAGDSSDFVGMAPDARIVSIKIADAQGQTDVSQAVAAIDWVVENKARNGLNIRVVNMSFGTDGVQSYQFDPLTYAVEAAWKAGVVVVVAAGNNGNATQLNDPAYDPFVIAVGSDNSNGTASTSDDSVSTFSNGGTATRNPDLLAPGEHVVSLRDPGSSLDTAFPAARVGSRLFRGSGTSQAAAVVSGAAALVLSRNPNLTPNQVKALLTGTASPIPGATAKLQGNGALNLAAVSTAALPSVWASAQNFVQANGTGSLEAARGSHHVTVNGTTVRGEVDVRGRSFDSAAVSAGISTRSNWNGLTWSGQSWSGLTSSGLTWSGLTPSGLTWSGLTWSGLTWSGLTWSGLTWSGADWS
jgi:serine protease AprX